MCQERSLPLPRIRVMTWCSWLQVHRGRRWRMQVVLEQLRSSVTDEFSVCVLGFVNALVNGAKGLIERCLIRDELEGMMTLQMESFLVLEREDIGITDDEHLQ